MPQKQLQVGEGPIGGMLESAEHNLGVYMQLSCVTQTGRSECV